ncbi:MAG: hypothetical protein RL660_1754 [Bacteroidota bacterium]|jgi:hypothetical protein
MKAFNILFLIVLTSSTQVKSQVTISKLDISRIQKSTLLKILKSNSDYYYETPVWTYFDSDSTYYLKDTIVIMNNNEYFYPDKDYCFQTRWKFVNLKKNYINIQEGAYLCTEPPKGARITFYEVKVKTENKKIFIHLLDANSKITEKLEVLQIETVATTGSCTPYRIMMYRHKLK